MSDWTPVAIAEYENAYKEHVTEGLCPYSGLMIGSCQRTDLCDCFDFPNGDTTAALQDGPPR